MQLRITLGYMHAFWKYVVRVAGTDRQTEIAERTGLGQPLLSRWKKRGPSDNLAAVTQFARAYGRNPQEAWVEAGYITADEIDGPDPNDAAALPTEVLWEELGRRTRGA